MFKIRKPMYTNEYADVDRHTGTCMRMERLLATHRWSSKCLMGKDEQFHAPSCSVVQRQTHAQIR